MRLKSVSFKIAVLFLVFTAVFTLFRSSMSGIFSLFYAKNGIPDANISSIKSFQNIGIMFGLLPAGYLADKVGRLKVLALSSLVIATIFFILILFRNFFFFSMAELLYGIGLALNSGILLAYVTDLQEQNEIAPSSRLMGMQVMTSFLSFSDNRAFSKKKDKYNIKNIVGFFRKRNFWILLLLNVGYDCGTQFILIYWSIIYVEKLGFNLSLVYTLFMCSLILGSVLFSKVSTSINSKKLTLLNTGCIYIKWNTKK